MADEFTWNNPNSSQHMAISQFLRECEARFEKHHDRMTFKPEQGKLVIGTMRALLDKRPSYMRE